MYSVIRFSSDTSVEILENIGEKLNDKAPRVFHGMDRVENRFSCELSSAEVWKAHIEAIRFFFSEHDEVLRTAASVNVMVCIDVAIEPEDVKDVPLRSIAFDNSLLDLLCSYKCCVELTVYGADQGDRGPREENGEERIS